MLECRVSDFEELEGSYKGGFDFVKGGVRFKMKNRGTIVVLQRYVKALCFLDVLEMVVR